MRLNPTEIRAMVFVLRYHRQAGNPIPLSVAALSKRVESAVLDGEASPWRQSEAPDPVDLNHVDLIGSKTAAERLGCSDRTVQRRASDFQGQKVGNRYVFPVAAVDRFRNHLENRNE